MPCAADNGWGPRVAAPPEPFTRADLEVVDRRGVLVGVEAVADPVE